MVRKKEWIVLLVVFALAAACFFLPFERLESTSSDLTAAASLNGWQLVSGNGQLTFGTGETAAVKYLADEEGHTRVNYAHMYSMMLCAAFIAMGGALLDKSGRRKCWIGVGASLVGGALGAWMLSHIPAVYCLGDKLKDAVTDYGSYRIAARAGSGLMIFTALCALGLALSLALMRFIPREEAAAPVSRTKIVTRVGVLGAIAAVLYYIPGIPVIPPIYKLDFSSVPVLLGGFSMGTVPALAILLIKDLIGLTNSSSMGVGELADFLTSAAMMITAVKIYQHRRTIKGALIGLLCGIAAMAVTGALANYFIMIPFYVQVMNMPLETIVSMIAKVIPPVDSLMSLILLATVPFNLLKSAVLALLTFVLYKRLSPLLK